MDQELDDIILDGWASGIGIAQTVQRAADEGFHVTAEEVSHSWETYQTQCDYYSAQALPF